MMKRIVFLFLALTLCGIAQAYDGPQWAVVNYKVAFNGNGGKALKMHYLAGTMLLLK